MATPLRRQKPISHRADGARDRIVAAALKALVEGDGEFEIGDVARRAKVSVGLAYHYFGSKAGLIAVLITDFHNRHEAVVNQSFDKSLPWPVREKARLKVNIDFLYSDPVAPVMMGKLGGSAEVTAIDSGGGPPWLKWPQRTFRRASGTDLSRRISMRKSRPRPLSAASTRPLRKPSHCASGRPPID